MEAELARTYAAAGRRREAQVRITKLLANRNTNGAHLAAQYPVYVYAALGEPDRAFEWLDRAIAEREPNVLWAKVDPLSMVCGRIEVRRIPDTSLKRTVNGQISSLDVRCMRQLDLSVLRTAAVSPHVQQEAFVADEVTITLEPLRLQAMANIALLKRHSRPMMQSAANSSRYWEPWSTT